MAHALPRLADTVLGKRRSSADHDLFRAVIQLEHHDIGARVDVHRKTIPGWSSAVALHDHFQRTSSKNVRTSLAKLGLLESGEVAASDWLTQWRMSVYLLAAHLREGRGISFGKIEQPVGTATVSAVDELNHSLTSRKLSQYSRPDDVLCE